MKLRFIVFFLFFQLYVLYIHAYSPINGLLERIDNGASKKFETAIIESSEDFFELDYKNGKVFVSGNNYVSIATGINWYLKYHLKIHLSWNGMKAKLPDVLPKLEKKERHKASLEHRYYLNYCTYSYSMAYWDWKRWEQEIDWMALHGINLPLSIVGMSTVWRNVLYRLGCSKDEIDEFITGPGFEAWFLMNNLVGWGGPYPDCRYEDQEKLQRKIVKRMREYGMEPVFPGYSGMIPYSLKDKLNIDISDPGYWGGGSFKRPAFLLPTNDKFDYIAEIYYQELTKLYGKVNYYSMDPFHEGGNTKGVDLNAAGKSIWKAMKKVNPKAVWVAQAWQVNPRAEMIKNIPAGDLIVLDLFSESRPQWGDPQSAWYREKGFMGHDWLFCMLLNFGGNVGLHGKMEHIINAYYKATDSKFGQTLRGVGLTMEGIENNPVMYELLLELPWHTNKINKDRWLNDYLISRYGKSHVSIQKAWNILSNTIYNCPPNSTQQGTHESIFCARPSLNTYQVSFCSEMKDYYDSKDIIKAAGLMLEAAKDFEGNNNFEYDLVDIVRQAVAEKGRLIYPVIVKAYESGDKELFGMTSKRFLELIILQDRLLSTRSEFMLGKWLNDARKCGNSPYESDLFEWNARLIITTWGNCMRLHDYSHREWNGLLSSFYYKRWKVYFEYLKDCLNGKSPQKVDFCQIEEEWTLEKGYFPSMPYGNPIEIAKEAYETIVR